MTKRLSLRAKVTLALAATVLAATTAFAYEAPEDLWRQRPATFAAWKHVVPKTYRHQQWIVRLFGVTAASVDTVTIQGKRFYYGQVCKAHDCGGNTVTYLIARDGTAAFGLLCSQSLHVRHQFFGKPDDETRRYLRARSDFGAC